jgi:hypothetical protein
MLLMGRDFRLAVATGKFLPLGVAQMSRFLRQSPAGGTDIDFFGHFPFLPLEKFL